MVRLQPVLGRILPFDIRGPALCRSRREGARPEKFPTPDGYIAAIAAAHGFAVASRDTSQGRSDDNRSLDRLTGVGMLRLRIK